MIKFKTLKAKNFLSFGNVEQELDLSGPNMAIIVGLNKDAVCTGEEGLGEGNRNGVGKSSIIQALCYVLYGKSIDNRIKLPKLINNVNKKNCEVSLEFEKNGSNYRIERGRGPTYLRVYENGKEKDAGEVDEAQGDSGDTQKYLERIIGMSQNMFQSIVVFSALTSNFLADPAAKQREFIEELLGLDQLSYKADVLKEKIKTNKALMMIEDAKIKSAIEYNNKTNAIINDLTKKSTEFEASKTNAILVAKNYLDSTSVDIITNELIKLQQNDAFIVAMGKISSLEQQLQQSITRAQQWLQTEQDKKHQLRGQLQRLAFVDIEVEKKSHAILDEIKIIEQQNAIINSKRNGLQLQIDQSSRLITALSHKVLSANQRLQQEYHNDTCPTCGSKVDEAAHNVVLLAVANEVVAVTDEYQTAQTEHDELVKQLDAIVVPLVPAKPITNYRTMAEVQAHTDTIARINDEIDKPIPASPFEAQISELTTAIEELKQQYLNVIEYKSPLFANKSAAEYELLKYQQAISNLDLMVASVNPYTDQLTSLNNNVTVISYDELNRLKTLIEHQEFLVKILTHKDSFVRKKLIEQNTGYLNTRLESYLAAAGSQFNITFSPDLSIKIESIGLEYDYDQLSRGERNRCILPLNLAFRDVFEALYGHTNLLFVDELLDNGLDPVGIHNAWDMLSDISAASNKNIFVISHREEVVSKSADILRIVKENRFSTIEKLDESN